MTYLTVPAARSGRSDLARVDPLGVSTASRDEGAQSEGRDPFPVAAGGNPLTPVATTYLSPSAG